MLRNGCFLKSEGQQAVQVVSQIFQVGDNGATMRILSVNDCLVDKPGGSKFRILDGVAPDQGQGQIGVVFTGDPYSRSEGTWE